MAASCWPSSIMWWSLTMGALALLPRLLFHCGSRLHHWLPTSPGCPCSLRDEVLSLYPTTGSAFPMGMVQRSRLCRLVHPTAGRYFSNIGLRRTLHVRSSQNVPSTHSG
jgi:hypothetical protein